MPKFITSSPGASSSSFSSYVPPVGTPSPCVNESPKAATRTLSAGGCTPYSRVARNPLLLDV